MLCRKIPHIPEREDTSESFIDPLNSVLGQVTIYFSLAEGFMFSGNEAYHEPSGDIIPEIILRPLEREFIDNITVHVYRKIGNTVPGYRIERLGNIHPDDGDDHYIQLSRTTSQKVRALIS